MTSFLEKFTFSFKKFEPLKTTFVNVHIDTAFPILPLPFSKRFQQRREQLKRLSDMNSSYDRI